MSETIRTRFICVQTRSFLQVTYFHVMGHTLLYPSIHINYMKHAQILGSTVGKQVVLPHTQFSYFVDVLHVPAGVSFGFSNFLPPPKNMLIGGPACLIHPGCIPISHSVFQGSPLDPP